MVVERYSHVMHLVSNVRGRLAPGRDALRRAPRHVPRRARSRGAPKIRAMEIIDELEPVRRGLYGGAVGYFDFDGDDGHLHRDPHACSSRDGARLRAGGRGHRRRLAIPSASTRECVNKARALIQALARSREGAAMSAACS